jgi:hypothetical protein
MLSVSWLQMIEPAAVVAVAEDPAWGLPTDGEFPKEALALGAAMMRRTTGALSRILIDRYRAFLAARDRPIPRSSSESEQDRAEHPIEQAIAKSRRFLDRGQRPEAYVLMRELVQDLRAALPEPETSTALAKWYARFPADVPVIPTVSQLDDWIGQLDRLLESLTLDAEEKDDADFFAMMRQGSGLPLDQARALGYDLPTDLLGAHRAARRMRNTFAIHLPPAVEGLLMERSPLELVVQGLPLVSRIAQELETQYPALAGLAWVLRVVDEDPAFPLPVVPPGRALELIIVERSRPRSVFPLVMFSVPGPDLSFWGTAVLWGCALGLCLWNPPIFPLNKTPQRRPAALYRCA